MPLPLRSGRFFVCSLLPECEDEDLSGYFAKFGRVVQANVVREKDTLMSRCCGFVSMSNASLVPKILEVEHVIWEHPVQVKSQPGPEDGDGLEVGPAAGKGLGSPAGKVGKGGKAGKAPAVAKQDAMEDDTSSGKKAGTHDDPGWFFVGRLPMVVADDEVFTFFSTFGEVEQVDMLKDGNGASRRCGYVKMADAEVADVILTEKEYDMDGNVILVKPCDNTPKSSTPAPDVAKARALTPKGSGTVTARATYGKGCYSKGASSMGYDDLGGKGKGPYGTKGKDAGAYEFDPYDPKGYGKGAMDSYDDFGMDDSWAGCGGNEKGAGKAARAGAKGSSGTLDANALDALLKGGSSGGGGKGKNRKGGGEKGGKEGSTGKEGKSLYGGKEGKESKEGQGYALKPKRDAIGKGASGGKEGADAYGCGEENGCSGGKKGKSSYGCAKGKGSYGDDAYTDGEAGGEEFEDDAPSSYKGAKGRGKGAAGAAGGTYGAVAEKGYGSYGGDSKGKAKGKGAAAKGSGYSAVYGCGYGDGAW